MTFENEINYLPNKQGFSLEHHIDKTELSNFRKAISDQWISKIKESSPEAYKKILDENISIEEYHLVSDYLDHSKVWSKSSRILNKDFTDWFLESDFARNIEIKYGKFFISDENNLGWPNIYWRLVRPNKSSDIGPLHRDYWFWKLNSHWCYEFFQSEKKYFRLKVWIPIHIEIGLNGLLVEPYSQNRENIKWYGEERHGIKKPVLLTPLNKLNPILLNTKVGNTVIFNDKLIHGGALNKGNKSRVSVEFTLIIEKND